MIWWRHVVFTLLAAAALLWLTGDAVATPLKDPQRAINGQRVDLTPLFHWWNNHSGERPLKAWVHVTGHIVATNAWGWTVEAHVEHSGDKEKDRKIILEHPPVHDQAEFEALKNQVRVLNEEHARLSAQATAAGNEAKSYAHKRHGGAASANYRQQETADKDQLKTVDEHLKQVNAKLAAYPNHDTFALDCLALDTGQLANGLPIYDHGQVFK